MSGHDEVYPGRTAGNRHHAISDRAKLSICDRSPSVRLRRKYGRWLIGLTRRRSPRARKRTADPVAADAAAAAGSSSGTPSEGAWPAPGGHRAIPDESRPLSCTPHTNTGFMRPRRTRVDLVSGPGSARPLVPRSNRHGPQRVAFSSAAGSRPSRRSCATRRRTAVRALDAEDRHGVLKLFSGWPRRG
jgi:hypothetical protein